MLKGTSTGIRSCSLRNRPGRLDFARYYGFRPRACQPYRAQTKGKVENGVKYVRGNFWAGLTYSTLTDLNQQAQHWLDTVANQRQHGTTHTAPATRLPLEHLQGLPHKPDYDTSLVCQRQSSRDCLVSYGGNHYSVPFAYACQPITLKESEAGEVLLFNAAGSEIARHRLAEGSHQRLSDPSHYQGLKPQTVRSTRCEAQQITPLAHPFVPAAPSVEVRSLHEYDQLLVVAP